MTRIIIASLAAFPASFAAGKIEEEQCIPPTLNRLLTKLTSNKLVLKGQVLQDQIARSVAEEEGKLIFPEGHLSIPIPGKSFRRPVHLERGKARWPDDETMEGKYVQVVIPVESIEEGYEIFSKILKHFPGFKGKLPPLEEGRVDFTVLKGRIHGEIYVAHGQFADTFKNLVINFPNGTNKIKESKNFVKALADMGMESTDRVQTIPLRTDSLRHDWGYYSFHGWAESLSPEEVRAFYKVGTGGYRPIHKYLREGVAAGIDDEKEIQGAVHHIDQAISRGRVDRTVTVYRADANPDLAKIWKKMASKSVGDSEEVLPVDKAYTFTTLDPKVADWWSKEHLNKPGIILEITVPEGSKAAYLDSQGLLENRGYLELLLPRESKFKPTKAYTRPNGQKVLKVELIP